MHRGGLMKRATLWAIGAGVASVALMIALRAQEQQGGKADPAKKEAAMAKGTATAEDKIAFSFSDDPQMQQFAQMWQQRQAVLTRMAVLQDYWNFEQSGLTASNKQLLEKFNLDVSKNYTLDTDRKVLVEREAVTPPTEQLGQAPAAAPAPAGETKTP